MFTLALAFTQPAPLGTEYTNNSRQGIYIGRT